MNLPKTLKFDSKILLGRKSHPKRESRWLSTGCLYNSSPILHPETKKIIEKPETDRINKLTDETRTCHGNEDGEMYRVVKNLVDWATIAEISG